MHLSDDKDRVYDLQKFVSEGVFATRSEPFSTYVPGGTRVSWDPDRFVFKEAPSKLFIGTGTRRREITAC